MDGQDLKTLIDHALDAFEGSERIGVAYQYLQNEFGAGRFNTERANEVFCMAVDDAFWMYIKGLPMSSLIYQEYKSSGLGKVYGAQLSRVFKDRTGAKDQRQARKFLRGILGA